MTDTATLIDDDNEDASESKALAAAVTDSDADRRTAPHQEVRAWLLRIAKATPKNYRFSPGRLLASRHGPACPGHL
jgi:hypothetical protein